MKALWQTVNVPIKKVRWLLLSNWSHAHLSRGVGFGEDGDRSSTADRLSEQFAGHEAFLETG